MGSPTKEARQHFGLLDSLRGLAAISILLLHVAIFSGGLEPWYGRFLAHLDIGVPLFFLLSAFLLYRPFLLARIEGDKRPGLLDYARRRFVRIAPAYWVVLSLAAIVPGMAGAFSGNWWVYYGLLQNYPIYTPEGTCAVDPFRCGIPTTWSLAVEVAFYALLPLLVVAMARWGPRGRGSGWLTTELMVFGVIAAASFWIQSSLPISDLHVWLFFSPLGRGWWFGLGLALAAISVWAQLRTDEPRTIGWLRRHGGAAPLAGLGIYALASIALLEPIPALAFPTVTPTLYLTEYFLTGLIALLALAPAILGADGGGLYRRILAHPLLSWLGRISYGIFLWQFPVLILLIDAGLLELWPQRAFLLLLLTTLAGTLACATASFYLLERPLLRRFRSARRPGPTPLGTDLATVAAPVAIDRGSSSELRPSPMRGGER